MPTFVPLLTADQVAALSPRARAVVEYRKSGLSLNHINGCPLGCAYCIRHTYDLWDAQQPKATMSDADAVAELVAHPYFQADITPVQVLNRSTDPMLPAVKHHTHAVLEDLDGRGLHNHVLVITRYKVGAEDCARFNRLQNIRLTLLFTYSGIDNRKIEPYPSAVAAASLRLATALAGRYRTVFYWRPLVPGLNDTAAHLAATVRLSRSAHASVFTGLFYRDQIAAYYKANGIPEPYDATARRKIVPATLEQRVLAAFERGNGGPLFRKTSCAVSYAHELPDYNGHVGIRELCDICPAAQLDRCLVAHRVPDEAAVRAAAARVPDTPPFEIIEITDRAIVVAGLDEQPRYHLQHTLGFQVHDARHPHRPHLHGRADVGWAPDRGETDA
jgi:DNA repair photolyase